MRICLLEPYDTGSHHAWLQGYKESSRHNIYPLTLKGRFWKWRMQGGAVTLARAYREWDGAPDLLLATDMLDLSAFLALSRELTHDLPTAMYMHENQLSYPIRPGASRDLHYGFINYVSMLCADRIFFNSQFHLDSWFEELPRMLKHFPDYNELGTVDALMTKSQVLSLGVDLRALDAYRPSESTKGSAIILWNHRWEYDKNPKAFLEAVYALDEAGVDFRLAILGENFGQLLPAFARARRRLRSHIVQFGYVESFAEYGRWLWRADIVASTAIQEFFGASIAEAMYCDCLPILPHRLNYPQFVPEGYQDVCLYEDEREFISLLKRAIERIDHHREHSLRQMVTSYDWMHMAPAYDGCLEALVET
ncbi:MAG: DUF3524 domain-containing protein [Anaerolineales bacterium]